MDPADVAINTLETVTVWASVALVPFACALAWLMAVRRIRSGAEPGIAWRHSLAEVGMVAGTLPWLFLGLTSRGGTGGVQLIPLVDLADLAGAEPVRILEQLVGNLVVFFCFACFAPLRWRIGLGTVVLAAAAAATALEIAQLLFVSGRVVSVDDVLLNTLGAALAALASKRWWLASRVRGGGEPAAGTAVLVSACRDWRGRRSPRFPVARTGQLVVEGALRRRSGGAPPGSGTAEPVTAVERLGRSHIRATRSSAFHERAAQARQAGPHLRVRQDRRRRAGR